MPGEVVLFIGIIKTKPSVLDCLMLGKGQPALTGHHSTS